MSATATIATEAGHWYTETGEPAYTVPKAKGDGDRPTTITDARRLGLYPSFSTISKEAYKYNLEVWKIDQAIMAALTLPRNPGELEADWIKRVKFDARETGQKAADKGTAIHTAIEQVLLRQPVDPVWKAHAEEGLKAAAILVGHQTWAAEKSYCDPELGYGGRVDLYSEGDIPALVDFKSKDFTDPHKVGLYDEHLMQLAAGRRGLRLPENTRCAIVFVSRLQPLSCLLEISKAEEKKGWEMFRNLLAYWQAKNDYPNSWKRRNA